MGFWIWLLRYVTGWPALPAAKEPHSADDWLRLAYEFYDRMDYDKTLDCIDRAIQLEPVSTTALYDRAYCCLRQRKTAEAVAGFTSVLEINPYDEAAFLLRGSAYDLLREHTKAIEDYSKVIELNPEDPAVYVSRGDAYMRKKENDEALDDYSRAIELDPESVRGYSGVFLLPVSTPHGIMPHQHLRSAPGDHAPCRYTCFADQPGPARRSK